MLVKINLLGGGRTTSRESQFELLRLIAQFLIVLYHLLLFFVVPYSQSIYYKALMMPLHIGVILFILLSGYFGIKASSKGLIKLMFIFTVYSLPEILFKLHDAQNWKESASSLFFFSHTNFWFLRTYVFLYLLSPMVNCFIQTLGSRQRLYMLLAQFFICVYIGTVGGDPAMADGKNALNFIFIYMLGNTLHVYKNQLDKISPKVLICAFLLLNILVVFSYVGTSDTLIGKAIGRLSFPYCSPILLLNAMMLFLLFGRLSFKSRLVNWLAQSSLAIYLIHSNEPLFIEVKEGGPSGGLIGMMLKTGYGCAGNGIEFFMYLIAVSLVVIFMAIAIDKFLTPIWNVGNALAVRIYTRLGY